MSDLPMFIAGVIVGLVAGLILGRMRQTEVIGAGSMSNAFTTRRASPAPPQSAPRPSTVSQPYVGRASLLRRLATDLAEKRDRSGSSARRQDP